MVGIGVFGRPPADFSAKKTTIYNINRLVLVGNGFDLAHGYKTRYTDFLFQYLDKAISTFYDKNEYQDQLIDISYTYIGHTFYGSRDKRLTIEEVFNELMKIKENRISKVNFKSRLLENLLVKLNSNKNWVDIENEYYELLKYYQKANNEKMILALNRDMDYLIEELEKHLIDQTKNNDCFRAQTFTDSLFDKALKDDIVTFDLNQNLIPDSVLILNFNYTDTIKNYIKPKFKNQIIENNFIHGELNNKDNPIVFGFGDELDANYLKLERKNDNNLFRHIKSFKYFKTQNYHNLIRFIDSREFQVYIVGHSCGLSDRTMLNQIFEHENCVSIKIFYHQKKNGSNDYTEKTHEISRHFRDKAMMRKKIVPEVNSHPMPIPQKLK